MVFETNKKKYLKKWDSNEKAKTKTKDTNTKNNKTKQNKNWDSMGGPHPKQKKSNQKKNKRNQNKKKKHRFRTPWGVPGSPTKTKKNQRFGTLEGRAVLSRVCFFYFFFGFSFFDFVFFFLVGDPPWGPKFLAFWFWFLWFWFF